MRTRLALAVVLTSMAAEFAIARGPRREMPIPSEVASQPVTAFVFDFGSTMNRCASVLESTREFPYNRETFHVVTGTYQDQNVVLVQDEQRNGEGDEKFATRWVVEHFSRVQRIVAVSSSTAVAPETLNRLLPVNSVLYNGVVHEAAFISDTAGIAVMTMDGLTVPASLPPNVQVVDQLLGHVALVAAERAIPWQAYTFPSATAEQVNSVQWEDYTDAYLNLPMISLGKLFVAHKSIACAYKDSKELLLDQAASMIPRILGDTNVASN